MEKDGFRDRAQPSPVIREITDDDVDAVIALWRASGLTRPWNDPARDIAFARQGGHSTVLVAETETGIAATAMTGHDGHRGWVYYVASAPDQRGKGLGRAIMRAAEEWLREQGVWKLQVLVRNGNTQATGFYQRLGYRDCLVSCLQKTLEPDGQAE